MPSHPSNGLPCPAAGCHSRFLKVNGILLPGGGAPLEPGSGYYDVSAQLLQLAKEANDAGTVFPVRKDRTGDQLYSCILESLEALISSRLSLTTPQWSQAGPWP